jgi:outer membrane lipoprotein
MIYRIGIRKSMLRPVRSLPFPFLSVALLLFMASACAVPAPMSAVRKDVREDLPLRAVLGNPSVHKGELVVWGGVILRSVKKEGLTDLYIEEQPFDFRGRPKERELSEGVFIGRGPELPDHEAYTAGRKVTIAGEIAGEELGTYNGEPYVYPVIRIKEIHLWKEDSPPIRWNWGRVPYYWPDEYMPDQERRPTP